MHDIPRPKFHDAPGITWRRLANGWEARWRCRRDLLLRGYPKKYQHLWSGTEPTELDRKVVSDWCNRLQGEMLLWGRGGLPSNAPFDGTLRMLIHCYQTDKDSTYSKLRYATRKVHDTLLRRLADQYGTVHLKDIRARVVLRWHEEWAADGKITTAHGFVGQLRRLVGFGATILENKECERMRGVLSAMRFPQGGARTERLTAEQAIAIRAEAHKQGWPSIALAQALAFELMLRQKDVIGEWVPHAEPGTSDVLYDDLKWLRGLRWSEVDEHLTLRHQTSKKGKPYEGSLMLAPMIVEELQALAGVAEIRRDLFPASGPIIVCERTGRPFKGSDFRFRWRSIAKAVGIPDEVYNMDSRAGGITEATDAGADLEYVRHAATHSDVKMTQKYSRGSAQKTARVMQLRAEHRNKGKP